MPAIDRVDVERIMQAAHAAGPDALGLYDIIRHAADGERREWLDDPEPRMSPLTSRSTDMSFGVPGHTTRGPGSRRYGEAGAQIVTVVRRA